MTWPKIETAVENAARRSRGRYTAPLIKEYARKGLWQIWIVIDDGGICGVCGTQLFTYDTGLKELTFRFCTGRDREKWQHFVDDIIAWGKANGCGIAAGIMRRGWRRVLPNWNHTHDYLERIL